MRLLEKTPLDIIRKDHTEAYVKDGVKVIPQDSTRTLPIRCSLQPYRSSDRKVRVPEGVETRASYLIYTRHKLQAQDAILNIPSDETIIDGIEYEIFQEDNWTHYHLKTDHYRYVLLRKDKK